ncbi:MAG: hypothetical protein WBQ73_02500 [Candidatus Babeliales bacterium]
MLFLFQLKRSIRAVFVLTVFMFFSVRCCSNETLAVHKTLIGNSFEGMRSLHVPSFVEKQPIIVGMAVINLTALTTYYRYRKRKYTVRLEREKDLVIQFEPTAESLPKSSEEAVEESIEYNKLLRAFNEQLKQATSFDGLKKPLDDVCKYMDQESKNDFWDWMSFILALPLSFCFMMFEGELFPGYLETRRDFFWLYFNQGPAYRVDLKKYVEQACTQQIKLKLAKHEKST